MKLFWLCSGCALVVLLLDLVLEMLLHVFYFFIEMSLNFHHFVPRILPKQGTAIHLICFLLLLFLMAVKLMKLMFMGNYKVALSGIDFVLAVFFSLFEKFQC
jgi:hypothetical protein